MKYILPFLLAASLHADDTDGIKTREEIFESKSQTEYFIINDIISEKTIYIPLK